VGAAQAAGVKHLLPGPAVGARGALGDGAKEPRRAQRGQLAHVCKLLAQRGRSGGGRGGGGGGGGAASAGATAAVTLTEVGPRFEMRPYMIRLGTLDQEGAEVEWQLRSFTNTARKRDVL
jgi:hypothetical protein